MTIEDETGSREHHRLAEAWRRAAPRRCVESRLLEVQGELQREQGVTHVIARRLIDRSALLGELLARSRDFH